MARFRGITRATPECLKPLYLRAFAGMYPDEPNRPERAHNPKVAGSNPAPAIQEKPGNRSKRRAPEVWGSHRFRGLSNGCQTSGRRPSTGLASWGRPRRMHPADQAGAPHVSAKRRPRWRTPVVTGSPDGERLQITATRRQLASRRLTSGRATLMGAGARWGVKAVHGRLGRLEFGRRTGAARTSATLGAWVQFARRIEGILGWRVDATHKPIPRSRRERDRASSSGGALWANQFRRGRDTGRDPRREGRSAWDIHRWGANRPQRNSATYPTRARPSAHPA